MDNFQLPNPLVQPPGFRSFPVWHEAPAQPLDPADVAKFVSGAASNRRFWSRFGARPKLKGASILDVGCGWGALCVDMAQAGARRVVGLDIDRRLVDFAQTYVAQHYPDLSTRVEFSAQELADWEPDQFDLIVSKDAFEHILDLDRMLRAMYVRLKPGGRVYAGFGPLYPSPYGDHDRRQVAFAGWGKWGEFLARLPWGHLLTTRQIVALHRRRQNNAAVVTMRDLGLNMLAASDFRRAFARSGFVVVDYRINQSERRWSQVLAALAKLPGLGDYLTHNIYCILEKPLAHAKVPHPGPPASPAYKGDSDALVDLYDSIPD